MPKVAHKIKQNKTKKYNVILKNHNKAKIAVAKSRKIEIIKVVERAKSKSNKKKT